MFIFFDFRYELKDIRLFEMNARNDEVDFVFAQAFERISHARGKNQFMLSFQAIAQCLKRTGDFLQDQYCGHAAYHVRYSLTNHSNSFSTACAAVSLATCSRYWAVV